LAPSTCAPAATSSSVPRSAVRLRGTDNGKIEGTKITIEADLDGHTLKRDLVLNAERITGEAHMSREGQIVQAKIDVGRVK
jgi:hypothetical protein